MEANFSILDLAIVQAYPARNLPPYRYRAKNYKSDEEPGLADTTQSIYGVVVYFCFVVRRHARRCPLLLTWHPERNNLVVC